MKQSLAFLLLLLACAGQAQDPLFSQYLVNKPLLNPALTALDEGTAFTINHRNQWRQIPKGFKTYSAAVETQWLQCARGRVHQPFFNFGFGFTALHDQEGQGLLCTTEGLLTFSAFHNFASNAAIHLGVGVGGGQKNIDFSKLTFADQLDAIDGKFLDRSGVPIVVGQRTFTNLSAGAALRFGHNMGLADGFQNLGISVRHIWRPKPVESLDQNRAEPLPYVVTAHYSGLFPVWADHVGSRSYFVYWSPHVMASWQGSFTTLAYGLTSSYRGITAGCFYRQAGLKNVSRNDNRLVFVCGLAWDAGRNTSFRLDYSYDYGLGPLAGAGAAHEIALRINLFHLGLGSCRSPSPTNGSNRNRIVCPRPGGSSPRSRAF